MVTGRPTLARIGVLRTDSIRVQSSLVNEFAETRGVGLCFERKRRKNERFFGDKSAWSNMKLFGCCCCFEFDRNKFGNDRLTGCCSVNGSKIWVQKKKKRKKQVDQITCRETVQYLVIWRWQTVFRCFRFLSSRK